MATIIIPMWESVDLSRVLAETYSELELSPAVPSARRYQSVCVSIIRQAVNMFISV